MVAFLPKDDWLVVGWVLVTKLIIFIFGVKSYQILENRRPMGAHPWLELWNRWDALHYQSLAQFGYNTNPPIKMTFYPFYPGCVRLIAQIIGDYLLSAFVVSAIASVFAAILLRRLVRLDFSDEIARRAVCFFLIFPTAYFLHIGYTESLFIALALATILAARTGRWGLASALGACCWMTRPMGIAILPTLGIEALHQWWATKRWDWRWVSIAFVPLGFGVFLLLNWQTTGNPFFFVQVREGFAIFASWPWESIRNAIGNLQRVPSEGEMVGAQELYFTLLGLICIVLCWIKLRPAYAMWATGNWALFASATFLSSAPRYCLPLFPIFIFFALISSNRFWKMALTMWSLLFLALFSSLFVRGWWAF